MHKTTLAAAYIAAALAAFIHSGQLAAPAPSTTYPLAGVVTTVDRAADLVTFRTGSGHLYSLTGCDDWLPGDVIACTMDDNGTPPDVSGTVSGPLITTKTGPASDPRVSGSPPARRRA